MRRMLFILLPLILLLTACSPALAKAEATTSATLPPTWTPTATATATSTFVPTPTASPTPTFTPTPTPITLPVTNGTPIPDLPYEVITAENVHRLRQIARYGYPRLLETNPYRLTADGTTIVVGTTLGLEFYDAATQTKTGGFEVEFLRSFDLTPDGQYLLTLVGETLTVWTKDGQKVREFNLPIGDAWDLNPAALSPDGALLAVQRKKTDWQDADKVEVYRVADGSLLDTVRGNGALFTPDGQYLAAVFDGSVRLYPAAELGQGWEKRLPKQTLPWCGGNERCGLVFAPDGLLAAVIRPSRVDVYQVEERKLVRQVSGWESDGYALPQVQFADGQMLVTTPPVYDRQGNVRVKAQAIAVDVATGAWLSRSEVEEGFFAYPDGGEVRTFRWQAEGEMPTMYRYKISANIENNRLDLYVLGGQDFGLVHCTYDGCSKQSFDLPINEIPVYDENLEKYILQFYPRWVLSREEKVYLQFSGHSFAVPDAKISGNLLIVRAAESPQSSEMAVFDISTGKLLYRFSAHDFALSENKIYLFSPDNFVEIAGGNIQKHKSLEACNKLIHAEYALCTIFGGNSPSPELDAANILDFAFVKGDFLVAIYSDGFIRVWAVVPEDISVR